MEKKPFNVFFTKLLLDYPLRGHLFVFCVAFTYTAFGYIFFAPDDMTLKSFVTHISIIALGFTLVRFGGIFLLKHKLNKRS